MRRLLSSLTCGVRSASNRTDNEQLGLDEASGEQSFKRRMGVGVSPAHSENGDSGRGDVTELRLEIAALRDDMKSIKAMLAQTLETRG